MTVCSRSIGAITAVALVALGVAGPARAGEPSPRAVALAARILDDVGLKSTVDAVVPYMLGELERNVVASHPEMKDAMHETMTAITPEFVKSEAGVLDDVAHVLAAGMSEPELEQTLAFFESSAGKKYVNEQGPVLQQLNVSGQAWRQQLSSTLLPRVREEMKKRGFEF